MDDIEDTTSDEDTQEKPAIRRAVHGAQCGLFFGATVVLALLFWWRTESRAAAAPPESQELLIQQSPTPEVCKHRGLTMVNNFSCRPAENIDFYFIEDYSFSIKQTISRSYTEAIQKFHVEKSDRIACLGFAEDLVPDNLVPDSIFSRGCEPRQRHINDHMSEHPHLSKTTNFVNLFESIRKRLIQERQAHEPHYKQGEPHLDLVIILSDGLHDPRNRPKPCSEAMLSPIPDEVSNALRNIKEQLVKYQDEVWIFLVLTGHPDTCAASLQYQWMKLSEHGLNVILPDKSNTPQGIVKEIVNTINDAQVRLELDALYIPPASRKRLDTEGILDIRYRIEVYADTETAIRNPRIPINRATLLDEESGKSILLISRNEAIKSGQFQAAHIDESQDFADLLFRLAPSAPPIDPNRTYSLNLNLGGSAYAPPFNIPRRWQSTLKNSLSRCKIALLILLTTALIGKTIYRSLIGSKDNTCDESAAPPGWLNSFLTLSFFSVSAGSFILDPQIDTDLQSAISIISLISVVCLQAKYNLMLECLVAVSTMLKLWGPGTIQS